MKLTIIDKYTFTMGIFPSVFAGRSYTCKFYDNSHVCIGLTLAQIEMFIKNVSIVQLIERDTLIIDS